LYKISIGDFLPVPEGAGLPDSSNTFGFTHRLEFDTVRAYYYSEDLSYCSLSSFSVRILGRLPGDARGHGPNRQERPGTSALHEPG